MKRVNRFKKIVATVMIAALTVGSLIMCPSACTETVLAANDVAINETNFDPVICAYLTENYDTDEDGYIDDVSQVTRISTGSSSNQVQSLKGIEKLTALKTLWIKFGTFTEIDLSKNTNLTDVEMNNCTNLTNVNVTGLNELTSLDFTQSNNITSLQGLNTLSALTNFKLYNSDITEFDFTSNPNLKNIDVSGASLTSLNVAGLSKLESLYCSYSALTELDLTGCTALTTLSCGNNSWSSVEPLDLTLTPNLEELRISGPLGESDTRTRIGRLTLPAGNKLEVLDISYNNITSLDVTNCTELKTLICSDNPIESLVLNNAKLESLSFTRSYAKPDESKAFALDTSKCPALVSVGLSWNYMINNVDFSNNLLLEELELDGTSVTSLDVTNNPALYDLDVDGLNITSLDLSHNTELLYLDVADCDLTSLDLSNNSKLTTLNMGGCAVKNLSLRNLSALDRVVANYSYGPDENNLLESIDFTGCTALTYVELESIENLHSVDLSDSVLLEELEIDLGKVLMCKLPSSNTTLNLDAAANRQYEVAVSDVEETFDLKTVVSNIDGTKISNVAGDKDASTVTINGTVLSGYQVGETISYQYDCGNGMYITGKVRISSLAKAANSWITPLTIEDWIYSSDNSTAKSPNAVAAYGTVTYTYSTSADGTYTDVVPSEAGTYYVKATVDASDIYTGLESLPVEFKINQATPTYTVPSGLTANVGQTLGDITLSSGFSWMDADTTSVGAVGTNTFKVKYTPTDTKNYVTVENIEVAIVVGVNTNAWITELTISDWTYGKTASEPGATSKYGTPVFTYSDSADGTYTENIPTNAGTYYAKATVAATDVYTGLESAPVQFKINKATPEYTVPDGLAANVGQTLSDVILPEGFSWMDDTSTSVGAMGSNTFKVKYTPADLNNYVVVENINVSIAVGINANEWTSSLAISDWTYGAEASEPVAASKYGTPVFTYSDSADGTYTDVVPSEAGTYYVKATVDATDVYAGLESAPVEFKINKATPEYTVPSDLTAKAGQKLSDVALPSGFSWMDAETTSVGAAGTNTFKVKYTPADIKNYVAVENIEVSIVVDLNTNEWTTELTMGDWTYGNTASVPVATSKYGNDTIKYTYSNSADGTYTEVKPSEAGTYYVKATVAETNLYTGLESAAVEFKINKAIPTYTVPSGLTAYVNQTLADVELPEGFSWMDAETTSVGAAGTNTFKVKYTPADTKNYVEVENIEVLVEVVEQEEPSEEPSEEPTDEPSEIVVVDAPNTGDNSMVMLWLTMLFISLIGMAITLNSKNNDIEAE